MGESFDAILNTPIGPVGVLLKAGKLAKIDFLPAPAFFYEGKSEALARVVDAINSYFFSSIETERLLQLELETCGTPFQNRVWFELRKIPLGQTITYGGLAQKLNSSAQAVGNACRANPYPLVIPCHRVVAKNHLGGFFGATHGPKTQMKTWLLAHESAFKNIH